MKTNLIVPVSENEIITLALQIEEIEIVIAVILIINSRDILPYLIQITVTQFLQSLFHRDMLARSSQLDIFRRVDCLMMEMFAQSFVLFCAFTD